MAPRKPVEQRIYQQTVIETYSKVAFAKHYDSKTALTAADEEGALPHHGP